MFNLETIPALDLNQRTVETANNMSMFNAGSVIAKDAQGTYRAGLVIMFGDIESPTAEQEKIIQERAESWRELCTKSFNDELSRRASWVPWSVCGPANYPSERMNKRADYAMKAAKEWSEKRDRFIDNTRDMLRKAVLQSPEDIIRAYRTGKCCDPISSDDNYAVEKLTARIEYLKEQHEEGKARNAHFRKYHTMKGYKDLTDEEAARQDAAIENAWLYHVPYAPFEVSNTLQNIKRLEGRLTEISRARDASKESEQQEQQYDGFSVCFSSSDCRINITFDGKPEAAIRDILKSNGFHWSPRELHWTRKDTANARWSLENIVVPALKNSAK